MAAAAPICVLAAAIAVTYTPALKHFPHSDQLSFFQDILGHDGFVDIVSHTYSYNRTRLTHPGDTQLFRPMFFVWLSGLHAFFGTYFEACQTLGIALHFLNCVLFFCVLRHFFRSRYNDDSPSSAALRVFDLLPFAMTLFFALNCAGMEQVVWYNIQPNMLAVALILGSVLCLLKAVDRSEGRGRFRLLTGAWLLMLLASFTYELGQGAAMVAGLFLICQTWSTWRRRVLVATCFAAIAVLYQAVNLHDRSMHARTFTDDVTLAGLAEKSLNFATVEHTVRYGLYTAVQPFLPCHVEVHRHGKIQIDETVWFGTLPEPSLMAPALLICGLWLGLTVVGARRMWARADGRAALQAALLAGIGGGQAALIVLGRMNLRSSPVVLALNSHYTYIALLFTLACSAVALAALRSARGRLVHAAGGLLAAGMVACAVVNALAASTANVDLAEVAKPQRKWLLPLRRFVAVHRHEPDFRFALAWNYEDLIPHNSEIPMPVVFYRRYLDHDQPRYVVSYEYQKFRGVPVAEWRKANPGPGPNWVPDFIGFERAHGLCYQIYYRDGWYYAPEFYQVRPLLACVEPNTIEWLWRAPDVPTLLQRIHASPPLSQLRGQALTWAEQQKKW